jgi:histidinol-phosphate aminotransferase
MQLGFEVPDSRANFLFARSNRMDGEALYLALKERGVLVRHFKKERIHDYVRITVGTKNQMECLIREIEDLLS